MIMTTAVPTPVAVKKEPDSSGSEGEPAPETGIRQDCQIGDLAKTNRVSLRVPTRQDGQAIHQLIKQCPPLDLNSVYTYLLLCEHFQQTCVVAEIDGELCGFVSAYIHPDRSDVLFVWQVAVHEQARGTGLGRSMLQALLGRPSTVAVRYLETTVGPDNVPSRRMFQALAASCDARIEESPLFESELFGSGNHDDERLLHIGPLTI